MQRYTEHDKGEDMILRYPFSTEQPITQEFGENPGNYAQFSMVAHNGIDFGTPTGTNVYAVLPGVVERATFDDGGYGFYIQVKHADGITTVYAHLSQIRVQPAVMVKAGQLIGQTGTSGNSTGPHLHFEARRQGLEGNGYHGAVDPRPLIEWPGDEPDEPIPPVVPGKIVRSGVVVVESLNVRGGPGTGYPIMAMLRKGDKLDLRELKEMEVWGMIEPGRWVALTWAGCELVHEV